MLHWHSDGVASRGLSRQPVILWVQRKRGQLPYSTDPHGKLRLISGAMPHARHTFQADLVFRAVGDGDSCEGEVDKGTPDVPLSGSGTLFASDDPCAMLIDVLLREDRRDWLLHPDILHGFMMEDKDWAVRLLATASLQCLTSASCPLVAASLGVFVQYLVHHSIGLPRELGQQLQVTANCFALGFAVTVLVFRAVCR